MSSAVSVVLVIFTTLTFAGLIWAFDRYIVKPPRDDSTGTGV